MSTCYDLIEFIEQEIPFNHFMGIRVESMEPGYAKLRLPYREEFVGDARRPALHGGIVSTLIDTCGGVALWSHCTPKDRLATIDLRVDYLRPAPLQDLIAVGKVELMGNRVGNVAIQIFADGEPDNVIAQGRGVYNIRRKDE